MITQPGESDTLRALASKMKRSERDLLFRKIFREESRRFNIDANLGRHLRIMDTWLAMMSNYGFALNDKSYGLVEGNVATAPQSFAKPQAWDKKLSDFRRLFPKISHVFNSTNFEFDNWVPGVAKNITANSKQYFACAPSEPRSASIILKAVGGIAKKIAKIIEEDDLIYSFGTDKPETFHDPYFFAYETVAKAINIARRKSTRNESSKDEELFQHKTAAVMKNSTASSKFHTLPTSSPWWTLRNSRQSHVPHP